MLLNLQGWKSKMATTSIWAVKDNLDRVLNYASNPLKTKETDMLLIMLSMMIKLKDNFMSVV